MRRRAEGTLDEGVRLLAGPETMSVGPHETNDWLRLKNRACGAAPVGAAVGTEPCEEIAWQ
jgi:hypothetical protein